MPAYHETIYICPAENGQPATIMDFPLWWDRGAFFREYGDRRIDTGNPFYVDYGLLMTSGEALAWDKRCSEAFTSHPASQKAHISEAMRRLEPLLRAASWVIVKSSEWESGLD